MIFSQELAQHNLSYTDYGNMHTEEHGGARHRRVDYSWCFSDVKVQRVIAARIAVLSDARKLPDTLKKIQALDTLAVDILSRSKSLYNRQGASVARRVGGLAAYWAALVYRCIRLGQDSVEVANEFKVTPWGIRQTLWRLNDVAKKLEAGVNVLGKQQATFARRWGTKVGRRPTWDINKAIKLRRAGYTLLTIAAQMGVAAEIVSHVLQRARVTVGSHGCAQSPKPGSRKYNHELVRQLRREGATYKEIAERFGMSRGAIRHICTGSIEAQKERAALGTGRPLPLIQPAPLKAR